MSDAKNVMSEIQSNSDSTKPPPPKKREDKRRVTTSPNDALQNESDSDTTIPLAFNPSKRVKSLSKHSLELDTSDEDDEDDEDDSIRVPSQKRKAILFSDEDDSDDSERKNHKDRIQKKKWTNNEEDIEDLVDTDTDEEDEDFMMAKKESLKKKYSRDLSKKRKVDCIDLQSSSSDEDSSSDEEVLVSKKPFKKRSAKEERRRSKSGTGEGWIKRNDESDSTSSSSSSESDLDETDKKLDRLDWLSSDSRDDKLNYLTTIKCDKDKVLQLLLWDCGFDFNIHTHQFEAVRFVAGYIASFPVSNVSDASSDDDDSGQEEDDEAVQKQLQEMLKLDIIGFHARQKTLSQPTLMLKERGMLLADEMGLGKTVEASAGAVLRTAAAAAMKKATTKKKKNRQLPTLIVTPQDDVMEQWYDTLIDGGIEPARIIILGEKMCDRNRRTKGSTVKKGSYILCTRYKLQSEMKKAFEYNTTELKAYQKKSLLFPNVPKLLLKKLRNQYRSAKGKEKNEYKKNKEPRQDCVTRLVGENTLEACFETVIVDEAHFHKNVLAFWGIGTALLGAQTKRTILLTGTPYNNSHRDMAALMTFIDPCHPSAKVAWWEKATQGTAQKIVEAVRDWRMTFMCRREKEILGKKLPTFQLKNEEDEGNVRRQREMMTIMMACLSCCRMANIHPVLPLAREVSKVFSPSRQHLLKQEEDKKYCVLCRGKTITQKIADAAAAAMNDGVKEESGLNMNKDNVARALAEMSGLAADMLDEEDYDQLSPFVDSNKDDEEKEKGPIIELGSDICKAAGSDCCHFAHEKCLELHQEQDCQDCPRCHDLSARLHYTEDRVVLCQEVDNIVTDKSGYTTTSKIDAALKWVNEVPENDKMIVMSFFKGSLDLLEGKLTDMGYECCRYDGDISKERRARDLKRFKTKANCRVLLASVQSGGVGLNIIEANHMLFLDRWFNPQVHDQAESRIHRLKQTKDVKITYLDSVGTVDIVMRQINMMKQENSKIVLADGSSIGMAADDMNYRDLSGIIGKSLHGIIQMRTLLKEKNAERGEPDAPLLPQEVEDLDSKLKEIIEARDERKKKKTARMKEEDNSSGSDNDDDDGEDGNDDDEKPFANNNPTTLNGDNESSDDDSDDDDNFLYGKSMFSSTSRKSNVKEERVKTKLEVLGSKSKDDKEEIIELSSDEEDSGDDDKAGSVPTKKESQSHTQFKHQEGSMKAQRSNDRHIHELTEDEQLQAAIKASMEEVEVNEDKENSGGPSRRDSGEGEEFFDCLDESKPPAAEKSSVEDGTSSSAGNVARIQIKLPNGKRIVKSFGENQLIRDVYTFVANSEEIKGKQFELKIGFPEP